MSHTVVQAKWLPFHRQHFQMHFPEWKLFYFDSNFTEICPQSSNWQYDTIGSDNGLAPNRCQAIIWTNDSLVYWCIYVTLELDELKLCNVNPSPPSAAYMSVNRVSIDKDNGLTNAGLWPIGPLGTNFSKILIKIQNFSFKIMLLKISSPKWWPFCQGGVDLTAKHREMHGCVVSIVATDALVLKHQAISIHNAD